MTTPYRELVRGARPDEVVRPHLEAAERGRVEEILCQRPGKQGVHVIFFRTSEAREALEMVKRHIKGIVEG